MSCYGLLDFSFSESIPFTPLHDPEVDQNCACGCDFHASEGKIIASGRCERPVRWLLITKENFYIKLKFKYFNLYENKQWVKIRNGGNTDSDLIAYSDGRDKLTHVTSTANQMLIEFYTEPAPLTTTVSYKQPHELNYTKVPTKPIHVHGFIASFTSNGKKATFYVLFILLYIYFILLLLASVDQQTLIS